jgi:hypothetical protein
MTAAALTRLPYLPEPGQPVGLVTVDHRWNAVTVPVLWGRLVWDVLAQRSGPVLEDRAAGHLLWVIPPDSADPWPDATAAGVRVHQAGAELLVCGQDGHRCGMRWLRVPTTQHHETDARELRTALEWILGPLAEAEPIQVCVSCGAPTRRGHLLARHVSSAGPDKELHACPACWREIARGGLGRHLRVVRQGPL